MEIYEYQMPPVMYYAEGEALCKPDFDNYEKCPLCKETVGWVPKRPYRIQLKGRVKTRPLPDDLFIWTWFQMGFSKKTVETVEKYGITGIEYYEKADKYVWKNETIDCEYYLPKIKRIELPTDFKKSRFSWLRQSEDDLKPYCKLCTRETKTYIFMMGLYFEMDKYDGTDIFKTYEWGDMIFVSQRFVDMVNNEGLTNFHFRPTRRIGDELLKMSGTDETKINWLHVTPETYYEFINSLNE
ncbi:MAG: hypothetical protein IKQ18_07825 [Clostridia bacterium]|nr:hypothetical protein [Clostridia bacterium]